MTDTIVALATPNSQSALGIIRVNGRMVLELCQKTCGLPSPTPRCAHLAKYTSLEQNTLDQIIMVYYEKGRSFTGENCMELTCHGNPIVLEEILNDLIQHGSRMANPGEFAHRAFQNGKIDLTQAEAIADLIGASNKQALSLANKTERLNSPSGHFLVALAQALEIVTIENVTATARTVFDVLIIISPVFVIIIYS